MTPKWGLGVAMLPVGALCFYQAHFGRTVLPKWPLSAHLFYSVFYSVSELGRVCFRQARVARAALPPSVLFPARAFTFLPVPPDPTCAHSHIWGFPTLRSWQNTTDSNAVFFSTEGSFRHSTENYYLVIGCLRSGESSLFAQMMRQAGYYLKQSSGQFRQVLSDSSSILTIEITWEY